MRPGEVETLLALGPAERLEPLTEMAREALNNGIDEVNREKLVTALVSVVQNGAGNALARMHAGEVLGRLGDPRLRTPDSDDYWAEFDVDAAVGRH